MRVIPNLKKKALKYIKKINALILSSKNPEIFTIASSIRGESLCKFLRIFGKTNSTLVVHAQNLVEIGFKFLEIKI